MGCMPYYESGEMETLTLFTQPMPPAVARMYHGINVQQSALVPRTELVVEIASVDAPSLEQTRFPRVGNMSYWDIELPVLAADRLRQFYRLTHMGDRYPPYQCFSLPPFLNGSNAIDLHFHQAGQRLALGDPVRPNDIQSGRPYVAVDGQSAFVHSMLGITYDRPLFNLSVLGRCGPLAVTKTAEVCYSFGGARIQPIIYESGHLALHQEVSSSAI